MPYRRLLAAAVLAAIPVAAMAQTDVFFSPAKLVRQGTNATPSAGAGSVIVQVMVKADGTFKVQRVLHTTNPGDNAAALEIAQTSTYTPGRKDGKPVDTFYDFTINFKAGSDAAEAPPSAETAAAYASIREGKYDQAKAQLAPVLLAHPNDEQANLMLGVADGFAGDAPGAAAAFEKAGTIPDRYKTLAVKSYGDAAVVALKAGKNDDAIAVAGRAIALQPTNFNAYFVRGVAESNAQKFDAAIADLEKARTLETSAKADAAAQAAVAYNLMAANLGAGHLDVASGQAKEAIRLDPSFAAKVDAFASVSLNNSAVEIANKGDRAGAVARLEAGAAAFPAATGALYAQAAYILATGPTPDWKKIKAEADKSLAAEPGNGRANLVAGIALANDKAPKDAVPYLNKAKASPTYATDAAFAKQVDDALKSLGPPAK